MKFYPEVYATLSNCCVMLIFSYNIIQIQDTTTDDDFAIEIQKPEYNFQFSCGYAKPTRSMTLADKDEFIHAIWLHHVFFLPHAELEQLCKGFRDTLQMDRAVSLSTWRAPAWCTSGYTSI